MENELIVNYSQIEGFCLLSYCITQFKEDDSFFTALHGTYKDIETNEIKYFSTTHLMEKGGIGYGIIWERYEEEKILINEIGGHQAPYINFEQYSSIQ